jgi:hypothetical protein
VDTYIRRECANSSRSHAGVRAEDRRAHHPDAYHANYANAGYANSNTDNANSSAGYANSSAVAHCDNDYDRGAGHRHH